jgi:hypothetical protein
LTRLGLYGAHRPRSRASRSYNQKPPRANSAKFAKEFFSIDQFEPRRYEFSNKGFGIAINDPSMMYFLHSMLTQDELDQIRGVVREESEPLKQDIKSLAKGQETLALQVEVINASQQRAEKQSQSDHAEIMEHLLTIADVTGAEHKALEKRVDRIEKHFNLPPVK